MIFEKLLQGQPEGIFGIGIMTLRLLVLFVQ